MSKPSLVSPSQKQTQPQEAELTTLQNSITAAKRKWDDQKRQIAKDAEVTIATTKQAVVEATADAKKELDLLQEKVRVAEEQFNEREKKYDDTLLVIKQSISEIEHAKTVLLHTHATLEDDNRTLNSEIAVNQDILGKLKTDTEALTAKFSDVSIQKQQLDEDFIVLQSNYDNLTDKFAKLQLDNEAEIQQFEHDIAVLEQKKQNLVQELFQQQKEEESTRKQMAAWSKELDERDKNLRIRESQVNDQEKSIARNYNLLSL